MHTLDQHLAELVKAGRITYEIGLEKCHHVEDFNRLVGRGSRASQSMSTPIGGIDGRRRTRRGADDGHRDARPSSTRSGTTKGKIVKGRIEAVEPGGRRRAA